MNRLACVTIIAAAIAVAVSPGVSAQTADPANGTWKLNPAKSTAKDGRALPQSQIRRHEVSTDTLKTVIDTTNAQGKTSHFEYTAKFDGKDYPVTGVPDVDTIALTRVDAYTIEAVEKKAGEPVDHIRRIVAKDGKSMIVESRGTTANGERIDRVLFYDKQ